MLPRVIALLIGILALAALRGAHDSLPGAQPFGDRLLALSARYAALTGLLAAAAFLAIARGWRIGPRAAGAVAAALALSALVTPSLPAPLWPLSDPAVLGRTGLALALPGAGLLWWLVFAPRNLGPADLPALLTFPLLFQALTLLRAWLLHEPPQPATGLVFSALALATAVAVILISRLPGRSS
jgi:hypothetical protein